MELTVERSPVSIHEELRDLAQRALGISAEEAWRRVQEGRYEGTILASRMHQLHFLLGTPGTRPEDSSDDPVD